VFLLKRDGSYLWVCVDQGCSSSAPIRADGLHAAIKNGIDAEVIGQVTTVLESFFDRSNDGKLVRR